MRRLLFAIFPVLLDCAPMQAQAEADMLEVGRSWNYTRSHVDGTTDDVSLRLVRDTLIGGRKSYILTYDTPEGSSERYALQSSSEHGGDVFFADLHDAGKRFGLLPHDMWMGSDEYSWYDSSRLLNVQPLPGKLRVSDEIQVGESTLRRWFFYQDGATEPNDVWVTGVGSRERGLLVDDQFSTIIGDDMLAFRSVTDAEGHKVLDRDDFSAPRQGDYGYKPLLKSGKTWYCAVSSKGRPRQGLVGWYYQYYTAGDTIIGGNTYYKILANNHYNNGECGKYMCALREEGQRVWAVDAGAAEESMLYDFKATGGETLSLSFDFGMPEFPFSGTTTKNGDLYDCRDGQYWHSHVYNNMTLTEGLGPMQGLLMPMMAGRTGAAFTLLLCTEDGKVIYDSGDLDKEIVMSIANAAVPERCADNAVYDLQGRRVGQGNNVTEYQGNKLPKGIYIQNGRKFVIK